MAGGGKNKKSIKQMVASQAESRLTCAICLEIIFDRSHDCEGQDSIFCEGSCQKWIHRTCAGLPDPAFDLIVKSKAPFFCFQCSLTAHASELKDLRSQVSSLTKELADLRSQPPVSQSKNNEESPGHRSYSSAVQSSSSTSEASACSRSPLKPKLSTVINEKERKFNVILSGLPECPKGTPWKDRVSMDEDAIVSAISKHIPSFNSLKIRDCIRLGKYSESNARMRPRPILVTLNRATDVTCVLSTHFPHDEIRVRPDLSPDARQIRSLLLAERRSLIDHDAIDSRNIKLRGNCIYIGDRLHGQVQNGTLMRRDSLGNHAPALQAVAESVQSQLRPITDASSTLDNDSLLTVSTSSSPDDPSRNESAQSLLHPIVNVSSALNNDSHLTVSTPSTPDDPSHNHVSGSQ